MSTRLLRNSERTSFTQCRWRWWYGYEEQLKPKVESPPLRFGTLIHKALESRYPPGIKRGPHPAKSFRQLYDAELEHAEGFGFRDSDGKWEDARELGIAMMNEFVHKFGKDERYRVISSEQTFRVNIAPGLAAVGTFDGVWQDRQTRHILLQDWKTTAQFWTKHLALDEQASFYWCFAPAWLKDQGLVGPKSELKGILFTFLRKAMPDTRPQNDLGQYLNQDGSVSKKQPPPLFERHMVYRDQQDRLQVRARVLAQAAEMQLVREGKMTLYKTPTRMNCSTCSFVDACELHETGADYMPLLRAAYTKWDPYADHEIAIEGH